MPERIVSCLALFLLLGSVSGKAASTSSCTQDTWIPTSSDNAPSGRYFHKAVWTGSEMIVWGGHDGNVLNTGGRYDPGTGSWTSTSNTNAPAARYYHSAVWTGSEMIVWGGQTNSAALNTGGRYNPATDSWTAISTVNAPAARTNHAAIWTGSEMIIWGGGQSDTGGRYNPATDSWTPISTTNAPATRAGPAVVWTGSEMIVWGGYNGSGLNTGGRYNPSTDSWTPTDTTNAPAARWNHGFVWTGSEMIVWGGYTGAQYTNTGGRYNPLTNGWTVTSVVNAPAGRQTRAVWTGSEMIFWGGYDGNSYLNTGGRYNPSTDGWTGFNLADAPTGRDGHTAIWADSEMIVWGGAANSVNFSNGGRYCGLPLTTTPTPTPTPVPITVSLPTDNFDTSVPIGSVFLEPVTTTLIDPSLRYVGFQGRFTYDSAVVNFSIPATQRAGLTSDPNWNITAHVFSGTGTTKILEIEGFSRDFVPLQGSGTLFELRMLRMSTTPGAMSPLNWQPSPSNFVFIDDSLDTHTSDQNNGLITITASTPTPLTPTPTPIPTSTPTPTTTPYAPTPTPTPTPGSVIVSLPTDSLDISVPIVTVIIEPVSTTFVDPDLHYIGFQGDFIYDSAVIGFSTSGAGSAPVQRAGLTSDPNWNFSGSILNTGPGSLKTLRLSALMAEFLPLNGSGVLFELKMRRVSSTPGEISPLNWSVIPNNFVFIDDNLDAHTPNQTDGLITITSSSTINISGSIFSCSSNLPGAVPNATLILAGSLSGSVSSNGSGDYEFSSLADGGNYVVTPMKSAVTPGSSSINTVDMIAMQRHFLQLTLLTGCRLAAGDVNGDNVINTLDIIATRQFFLGHETANVGKYRFNPPSRSYPGVMNAQTAEDYDALVLGDVAPPFVQ